MDTLKVEETVNTPKVILDADNHHMEFEGDSRPEDVQKFYKPIIIWLDEYEKYVPYVIEKGESPDLTCNFKFEYFNSSSAKYVMDIINKIGAIDDANEKLKTTINWHYDEMDEDMLDAGQEFEEMLNTKFNFVAIE